MIAELNNHHAEFEHSLAEYLDTNPTWAFEGPAAWDIAQEWMEEDKENKADFAVRPFCLWFNHWESNGACSLQGIDSLVAYSATEDERWDKLILRLYTEYLMSYQMKAYKDVIDDGRIEKAEYPEYDDMILLELDYAAATEMVVKFIYDDMQGEFTDDAISEIEIWNATSSLYDMPSFVGKEHAEHSFFGCVMTERAAKHIISRSHLIAIVEHGFEFALNDIACSLIVGDCNKKLKGFFKENEEE